MSLIVFLAVVGLLFLAPLLGALFGAFAGWVVGLMFSDTILTFFSQLGITGFEMWQIGLVLGFVGGFFKTVVTSKS